MPLTRRIRLTITFSILLWCTGFLLAPVLLSGGGLMEVTGNRLVSFYGHICHQIESRSLAMAAFPAAVCSRCMGVYVAFLVGTMITGFPFAMRWFAGTGRLLMIIALAPMLLDVAAGIIGLYESGNATRLLTGAWFGLFAGICIVPVAVDALADIVMRQVPTRREPLAG